MAREANKKQKPVEPPRSEGKLWEMTEECFFTRANRKNILDNLRSWYWRGAKVDEAPAEINRIYGEVNNLLSLIYSPEQIILDSQCEGHFEKTELPILKQLTKSVKDNFFYRRLDNASIEMAKNVLIDGCVFVHPIWLEGGVEWQEVPADHIGVMYESMPIDSKFQIFAIETELTEDQVKTWWPEVYRKVKGKMAKTPGESDSQIQVILGGQGSNEAVMDVHADRDYRPGSARDTFRCRQLFSFDHKYNQWRKATMVEQVLVNDEYTGRDHHAYFQLCSMPIRGYIWGHSMITLLYEMQNTRNDSLVKVKSASDRLLDPPLLITGYNVGDDGADEIKDKLRKPGGHAILNGMNVKAEAWTPKLDIKGTYDELEYRDMQSKYMYGLNEVMQGQSQKNVRSSGYANMLAQFASTELKRMAHLLEAQLEEIFTYNGQLFQENDATQYIDDKTGRTFLLAQFPFDYRVEIYGHTGSPIATENNISLAMQLAEMGKMPDDILIDLLPIPYKEELKEHCKKQAEAKSKEKQEAIARGDQPEPEQHKGAHSKGKGHLHAVGGVQG
jgi:hypothetical protein